MNINIGCGDHSIDGCEVNVDHRETPITTHVHDLESYPWPFKDKEFENGYAIDVIEHVLYVVRFLDECHRIIKPGGHLYIRTTYFMSEQSYRDPTHLHYFTLESFDYFDPDTDIGRHYPYTDKKWRVLDRGIDGQETVFELEKINV